MVLLAVVEDLVDALVRQARGGRDLPRRRARCVGVADRLLER